jgi:hypothetical protein
VAEFLRDIRRSRTSVAAQNRWPLSSAYSAQHESFTGSLYLEIATILSASAIVG